jgi:hypothetical protein
MPRKKKDSTQEEVKETKSKKHEEAVGTHEASETKDLLPKIQCFNHSKKTICANLNIQTHKCGVKTIASGRLANVRIGKKRRCAYYEESAYVE